MKLRYITCSGANEETSHEKLINLAKLSDLIEIGIVANSSIMRKGTPQNEWFEQLLSLNEIKNINLALHINSDWCTDFCNGSIAPELKKWLKIYTSNKQPVIKRWQFNIGNGMRLQGVKDLESIIKDNSDKEFIFSFNKNPIVVNYMTKLYKTGVPFSLLYDSSYGTGRDPKYWEEPYFAGRTHGYAGGLCGENIYQNLDKISSVVPYLYETWVDAEYKLKTPETNKFDVSLAKNYVNNAIKWQQLHTR